MSFPAHINVPLSKISMLTKIGSDGEKRDIIPASVSMPLKSSRLSHSVMKLGEQMAKKPFLGKGDQKSSEMINSSFS